MAIQSELIDEVEVPSWLLKAAARGLLLSVTDILEETLRSQEEGVVAIGKNQSSVSDMLDP
ncbi:MAG: hypothetical protein AAB371_02345 [Patescibacteria group bacterium]